MEVEGEEPETIETNQKEQPEAEPKRKRGRPSNASGNASGNADGSASTKKAFPIIAKNPGGKKVEDPNEPMYLPRSTISKIVKRKLPAEARVGKNETLVFQQAATIFIMYLTHFATDILKKEGKQTLTGKQVLEALETVEFRQFVATLTKEIQPKLASPKKSKITKKPSTNNTNNNNNTNDKNNDNIVIDGEDLAEQEEDDQEEEEEEEDDDDNQEDDEEEEEQDEDEGDDNEEEEGDDNVDDDNVDDDDDDDEENIEMNEDITRKKVIGKRKT